MSCQLTRRTSDSVRGLDRQHGAVGSQQDPLRDAAHDQFADRRTASEAEHYQIEAAMLRMPLDAYKGALDNLARNAIVKRHEDAR